MKKRRLPLILAPLACAAAITLAPAPAAGDVFTCPDFYFLAPASVAPDKDKNGNGFVCAKGPQGENAHVNSKDDHLDDIVLP